MLALTISLTFLTTTRFFGKLEVVDHTLLHGALFVFIVLGSGKAYRPPIAFHRNLGMRTLFAAVSFIILLAVLAVPCWWLAEPQFQKSAPLIHSR